MHKLRGCVVKKFVVLLLLVAFVTSSSAFAISKNEPFKKLSKGLSNVTYGTLEVPDNIDGTKSKGEKAFADCTDDTKSDVGRGVARIVGGLWELATFWYPSE